MVLTILQINLGQHIIDPICDILVFENFQRQADIFTGRQMGHQMKLLENNPDLCCSVSGKPVFFHGAQILSLKEYLT